MVYMKPTLTIGRLAKRVNTSTVTLRYYERKGLLSAVVRSQGGHRLYTDDIVKRFYFIRKAQSVGFSLDEIKELLSLQQRQQASSQTVRDLALAKLAEIEDKRKTLQQMEAALSAWTRACDGKVAIEHCPILKNLYA